MVQGHQYGLGSVKGLRVGVGGYGFNAFYEGKSAFHPVTDLGFFF